MKNGEDHILTLCPKCRAEIWHSPIRYPETCDICAYEFKTIEDEYDNEEE